MPVLLLLCCVQVLRDRAVVLGNTMLANRRGGLVIFPPLRHGRKLAARVRITVKAQSSGRNSSSSKSSGSSSISSTIRSDSNSGLPFTSSQCCCRHQHQESISNSIARPINSSRPRSRRPGVSPNSSGCSSNIKISNINSTRNCSNISNNSSSSTLSSSRNKSRRSAVSDGREEFPCEGAKRARGTKGRVAAGGVGMVLSAVLASLVRDANLPESFSDWEDKVNYNTSTTASSRHRL